MKITGKDRSAGWNEVANPEVRFEHRRAWGIPDQLHDRPILLASARVMQFPEGFRGNEKAPEYSPMIGYVDAAGVTPEVLIQFIAESCKSIRASTHSNPEWSVTFKYFEPLSVNGTPLSREASFESVTIALFHDTYEVMLPQLAALLQESDLLPEGANFDELPARDLTIEHLTCESSS